MSFFQQLNLFNRKAIKNAEITRKEINLRLFRAVVFDTPVLEGTLRGNWQPSTTTKAIGVVDVRGRSSGNAAMSAIQDIIEASKMDSTVFLTNNLPYAWRIEYEGYSKIKAPQGMVRKNIRRLDKISEAVARGVRNGRI
jgi:hypothetical protein